MHRMNYTAKYLSELLIMWQHMYRLELTFFLPVSFSEKAYESFRIKKKTFVRNY